MLWSDLYYSQDMEYFVFNNVTWPLYKVAELEQEIESQKRRLVTINDPHIKTSFDYFVYSEGQALQNATQNPTNITNCFIKLPDATTDYVGDCWPGPSSWVDYLNENAAAWWGSLYQYGKFLGTNYLFGTWNDMNEPSVFLPDG